MECVTRKEDMSPDGRLRILMEDDGDMIVIVVPASDEQSPSQSVQFCMLQGGGNSLHTRKALVALMAAMRLDNAERPNDYSGEGIV
ncbi:MAG: hypothetical protein E4H01_05745 [Lysobacterales bacterium]|nr:MAG: hypothetical protein E4H01_05745 [Xanthomonadales bacterium]